MVGDHGATAGADAVLVLSEASAASTRDSGRSF